MTDCRVPRVPYSEPVRASLGLGRTGSEYGTRGTQIVFSRLNSAHWDRLRLFSHEPKKFDGLALGPPLLLSDDRRPSGFGPAVLDRTGIGGSDSVGSPQPDPTTMTEVGARCDTE